MPSHSGMAQTPILSKPLGRLKSGSDVAALWLVAGASIRSAPVGCAAPLSQRGTMRYFEISYVDMDNDGALQDLLASKSEADGRIVISISTSQQLPLAHTTARLDPQDAQGKPLILAAPRDFQVISEDLVEVEAWEYVASHSPELLTDEPARQEVRARLKVARGRLAQRIGPQLSLPGHVFDPTLVHWRYGEEQFGGKTAESFRQWLSSIFDRSYSKAPILKNELLNRGTLSSAASRARRNLMEAMLKSNQVAGLGFDGYPPERSMYESMLLAGGFHRDSKLGVTSLSRKTWCASSATWTRVAQWLRPSCEPLCDL